ncbi:hypothetical protein EIN_408620 [Entamoeba invadens IP1]|uniref:Uncharacterized protein n=1 Tax=Entamoeba invadens IP1 TaxID=370355 RepID=A0A0A1U261_ENTIV|nr:hypothetical protein EIN_408620 [Entamoeba invadens IP1]ELP85593.1 hypothetical protein EIN_408620 [Entamoeba invadens IP1]|eukprot:XP_004184939.1 hypothetical protein EIN_408620 [Entamoeba invadens IP1]
MFGVFISLIVMCLAEERLVYKNGIFSNGYQLKASTGYTSTTAEYNNNIVIYIMLSQNGYANFKTSAPIDMTKFKYLSFIVSWEQDGCNLGLAVSVGDGQKVDVTGSMGVNKLNRIYVDVSQSTFNTTSSTFRIYKTDKTDSNIYFNDVKFTSEKGNEGVYSLSTDMDNNDGSVICVIVALALLVLGLF